MHRVAASVVVAEKSLSMARSPIQSRAQTRKLGSSTTFTFNKIGQTFVLRFQNHLLER